MKTGKMNFDVAIGQLLKELFHCSMASCSNPDFQRINIIKHF